MLCWFFVLGSAIYTAFHSIFTNFTKDMPVVLQSRDSRLLATDDVAAIEHVRKP